MDVRSLPLPSQSVDLVIDKGCLDAMLCGENASRNAAVMSKQMHRVLRPGKSLSLLDISTGFFIFPLLSLPLFLSLSLS